jgi:hypothetical protein
MGFKYCDHFTLIPFSLLIVFSCPSERKELNFIAFDTISIANQFRTNEYILDLNFCLLWKHKFHNTALAHHHFFFPYISQNSPFTPISILPILWLQKKIQNPTHVKPKKFLV